MSQSKATINIYYRLLFLYVEPISALAGAIAAASPSTYLTLLSSSSSSSTAGLAPRSTSTGTSITLNMLGQSATIGTAVNQLANLYLFFFLAEALVLRASRDFLPVWRALLTAMLIADFGHLAAGFRLGKEQYWQVWQWDAFAMGSIGFVYVGAVSRIAFLCGMGVRDGKVQGEQDGMKTTTATRKKRS